MTISLEQILIGLLLLSLVVFGYALGAGLTKNSFSNDIIGGEVSINAGEYLPAVVYQCGVSK